MFSHASMKTNRSAPPPLHTRASLRTVSALLGIFIGGLAALPAMPARAAEPIGEPIIRIEAGMHTSRINHISVDRSEKVALTCSQDRTARLWELPTGRLLRVLRPPIGRGKEGELNGCALSPDGTLAAVGGWTGVEWDRSDSIYIFDTNTGQMVHRLTGSTDVIQDIAFSANGRFLACVHLDGKGVRVWSTDTWKEIGRDEQYHQRDSYGVDWSGDDRLVTTCHDGSVRLYEIRDNQLNLVTQRAVAGGSLPFTARFSPDGTQIAVGFMGSPKVSVVSADKLAFLFAADTAGVGKGSLSSVSWSRDGAVLAAGGTYSGVKTGTLESYIRVWSKGGQGEPKDVLAGENTISDIRPLSNGAVIYSTGDPVWGIIADGRATRLGQSPIADFRSNIPNFRVSNDGATVAFSYANGGKRPATFSVLNRDIHLLQGERFPAALHGPKLDGLRITNWANSFAPKLNGKTIPLLRNEFSRCLDVGLQGEGFLLGTEFLLRCYYANGMEKWETPTPGAAWATNAAMNDQLAVTAYGDGVIRWQRTADGLGILAFFPHADQKRWVAWSADFQPAGLLGALINDQSGNPVIAQVSPGLPAAMAGIRQFDQIMQVDGESVSTTERTIEIIRAHPPGSQVRLTVLRNGVQLSGNITLGQSMAPGALLGIYYDCSPGAEDLIGWHVNRGKDAAADFFPAAKFRDRFFRPDIIARVLENGDVTKARLAANQAAGIRAPDAAQASAPLRAVLDRVSPPVVELTGGGVNGEVTVPAGADHFTVRYRVRRAGSEPVTRVRCLVDGRPVATEAPVPGSDTAEASASVPVPAHDCILAVLAENKFAVSEPAALRLGRQPPPAPAPGPSVPAPSVPSKPASAAPAEVPAALKPKLYLFAAGIAHYKNNDQLPNLAYPPKDAQDFAAVFKRQEGGLYQKVESRVITEDGAKAGDILDGLEWIKHQTTSKDIAVVFLSGHGDNDEEHRFYFCAQDYDRARRLRTGVSFEDIQKTLSSIAGKVLFFIDSCHAGNALGKLYAAKGAATGGSDLTRLVNELSSAENGAVVFASSTGKQESLESDEWKNGAFTKAIVEGLNGKADLMQNGKITVNELETYLAERVKELTEGQQTPTVAKPQTVPDFPIAIKR
jgi:WD40 repeat protein